MKGFDPRWKDFPDYILGITHQIWEGRDLKSLNEYYAQDLVVRSPGSVVSGNQNVIAATMATLTEFPDRELLGEDVIWSGSDSDGMLSSHRILSTATHLGDGVYGAASGRRLRYRIIADCHAINNQINDEWLIRDQGAIVRQMGWQPASFARDLIEREGGAESCVKPFTPQIDVAGPYQGKGNDNEWGQRYVALLERAMQADFTVFESEYDRAASLFYPGGVETQSFVAASQFWLGLRSSFPSAVFSVEHSIGREDSLMPPRAAVRWSLTGRHDGWGVFGKPTGAEVHVMGVSHAEFGPWGLRREYVLFDETAIWKQIILQIG